jgi:hypothetical protein
VKTIEIPLPARARDERRSPAQIDDKREMDGCRKRADEIQSPVKVPSPGRQGARRPAARPVEDRDDPGEIRAGARRLDVAPTNEVFSAMVNRLWKHFGIGMIDPVDDLRRAIRRRTARSGAMNRGSSRAASTCAT